jgi:hypothetical protein
MIGRIAALILLMAVRVAGAEPAIGEFYEAASGQYQVLAQSGRETGWQVNRFMNEMLRQYSRYFSNWSLKAAARVVVFDNVEDFRAYSAASTGLTHSGLTGYCHLKTDEDGNTFYELVTYEHDGLWQVLAHEGFHQFLGYELGLCVPMWLNEGLAQYFETSYPRKPSGLQTGLVSKRRLLAAQRLIRAQRAPALAELLQMDRATFYADPQVNYPMSWALVYYLFNRDGSTYRNSRFRRFLQDLKFGQDEFVSFQRRFGRDSYQWQRDFEMFILNLQPHVD